MNLTDRMKEAISGVLIGSLLMLGNGCQSGREVGLTGELWSDSRVYHYEPAENPNLRLYEKPDHSDILVQYDESSERNGHIKNRFYFLIANQSRLSARKKPRFVHPKSLDQMLPVMVEFAGGTNAPPTVGFFARVSEDGRRFTLTQDGRDLGTYDLPVYVDQTVWIERMLFTPATAAVDIAIVAAIIAGCVALAYLESRN